MSYYFVLLLFVVIINYYCTAKIQYLENGANYIKVCCDFTSVEVYEITFDDDNQEVLWKQTLNSTPIANVTSDYFIFSNIRRGYIIPLIQRYGLQLYKWYVMCFDSETAQDCIYVRPCDCSCVKRSWLKYNITATVKESPSDEFNITISFDFDNSTFPLPVLPAYSWFAGDYDAIMMCKSGEISPINCDFMLSGSGTLYTHKSMAVNFVKLDLHLDSWKVYFSLSFILDPRWSNRLPTVDETTFDPEVVIISRNETLSFFKEYTIAQVYEEKLSGRNATSAFDKNRQCTDVGSIAMADALQNIDNGGSLVKLSELSFLLLIYGLFMRL